MKRFSVTMSFVVACAAAGTARAATLVPAPQTYVFEVQTGIAQFPASPFLDLSPQYTIEFWVMHENNSSSPFFGKAIPNSSALAYGFGFDSSGGINYGQSTGVASTYVQVTSSSVLPLHTWTHVAATSDGANITLYVDGAQAGEVASPGTPQNITSIPLQLGMGIDYIFAVRQLRFWNVALTPQQLEVSATSRLSGNEPGLVADWPFEDGTVGITHDIGPNHLDLPLPGVGDYSPPHSYMRWIHTAVLDAGPFFSTEGPFPATSLNGTTFFLTAAAVIHLGSPGVADIFTLAESSDPNVPGPLVVLRNDGSGHFSDQSVATFGGAGPTVFGARRLVVADFDGDGRDDLFIPVIGEGRMPNWGGQNHLLLQAVAGQLTDVTATNLPQVNTYSYFALAGDIDGSGRQGIYVANVHFSQVLPPLGPLFLDNDGTGRFTIDQARLPSDFLEPEPGGSLWNAGILIDARKLGRLDLVACPKNQAGPTTTDTLLLNDGHGYFTEAPAGTMPTSSQVFATVEMAMGDFDGDGWEDLVEEGVGVDNPAVAGNASMRVLLNNHDGTFREAVGAIPWAGNHEIAFTDQLGQIQVADFNGDGKPDIFVEAAIPLLYLNTGGAHFIDASEVLPLDFVRWGGVSHVVADLDGNGSIDLIGVGTEGQSWTVARQLKAASLDLFKPVERARRHLRNAGQ